MKKNSGDGVFSRNDGSATTVAANGALPGGGDGGGGITTPLKEERWEKIHLSTEDERTKGSMDVSVVKLATSRFESEVGLSVNFERTRRAHALGDDRPGGRGLEVAETFRAKRAAKRERAGRAVGGVEVLERERLF